MRTLWRRWVAVGLLALVPWVLPRPTLPGCEVVWVPAGTDIGVCVD